MNLLQLGLSVAEKKLEVGNMGSTKKGMVEAITLLCLLSIGVSFVLEFLPLVNAMNKDRISQVSYTKIYHNRRSNTTLLSKQENEELVKAAIKVQ
ncbi:unnamed protein product, partial [Discosporangium mesarthrocarpum]